MNATKPNANDNNNISNFSNNNHSYTTTTETTEQCTSVSGDDKALMLTEEDAASDYIQWLHAMKLVAQLPGGMPPEFRRKLWLSLADKYLKAKKIDWAKEEEKCFCEKWREDDEELGIQIVKDLHRTGSNLCTGPSATVNQAKLKRILLGYARYNPEVGYCQGFNMLGALILQVMDKNEYESMKVMIYLVEGVLPPGYFHGAMCGLQADMGVFRELMQTKLPRLAKHLQKLQGPVENAFEPPLTNVFTMQWFLTMFCTCLPMTCVLRVWDLVLIEGSDVLLRTALVLWSLLEERVLSARTADDFYCKMGSFSSELLNGHLIDSNGLVEKVVKFGPITEIQKLRDKHLYNIAPLQNKEGIQLYYDEEETGSDDESRLAIATVWGLPWGRRGSQGKEAAKQQPAENKERMALDISLLKKQYDRLRERQKQAQLIITTACNTARSTTNTLPGNPPSLAVNQLLLGRQAILSNHGKRSGAPSNLIPPARKPSLPAVLQIKPTNKKLTRGETLHWRDTDFSKSRRDSLSWKEIKADREVVLNEATSASLKSQKLRRGIGKSDSSSYSEESDPENGSSTDTSLCDDDDIKSTDERTHSSIEDSPVRRARSLRKKKIIAEKASVEKQENLHKPRPKSWAPSSGEIPFVLMASDSPNHSGDEKFEEISKEVDYETSTANSRMLGDGEDDAKYNYTPLAGDLFLVKPDTSQIEQAIPDSYTEFKDENISEPQSSMYASIIPDATNSSLGAEKPKVADTGVTNQYFERVNSTERPTKLNLSYSLNEEDSIRNAYLDEPLHISPPIPTSDPLATSHSLKSPKTEVSILSSKNDYASMERDAELVSHMKELNANENQPDLLRDTLKKKFDRPTDNFTRRLTFSAADETEIFNKPTHSEKLRNKRRDPRRMTLTRSSTIEIEERFRALEQNDVFKTIPENKTQKTIPSTADLEARYSSLQKQFRSNSYDQPNGFIRNKTSFEIHQVSKDADQLSNSLTRQMSSNETNRMEEKQTSPTSPKKSPTDDQRQQATKEVKISNSDNVKSATSQSAEKDVNEEMKAEKPVLKKIPSTAELEDRYNALERRLSENKNVAIKAKKKPPEESTSETLERRTPLGESKESINEDLNDRNNEKSAKSVSPKEVNSNKEELQKKTALTASDDDKSAHAAEVAENKSEQIAAKESIDEDQTQRTKRTDNIALEGSHKTPPKTSSPEMSEKEASKASPVKHKKENEQSSSTSPLKTEETGVKNALTNKQELNHRKLPPTTEELEKRFKAIEKQLSISTIEEPTQLKEEQSIKPDKTEEKKTSDDESTIKTRNTEADNQEKPEETHKKKDNLESKASVDATEKTDPDETPNKNRELRSKQEERKESKESKDILVAEETLEQNCSDTPKRRGSEPPSTVDLEKRYEILKRRMSSRTITENSPKMIGVLDALSHKNKDEFKENVTEEHEEEAENQKPLTKSKSEKKSTNLPTTEDLESRFEALHMNTEAQHKQTAQKESKHQKPEATKPKEINEKENSSEDKSLASFTIPQAPPQPVSTGEEFLKVLVLDDTKRSQQRALVEELQKKIKVPLNGENLKPSTINPNRKKYPKTHNKIDVTSEAHASSAYHWSENHELWHPKKTVRRFSDLPSRADLENRLEFLERQLYAKFIKQRCASDSEVTSMKTANDLSAKPNDNKISNTSKPKPTASPNLEERVQTLEKQLSENSLKLLETLRLREQEITHNEVPLSRDLSTETINVTGRELVRYSQSGELEETEGHKPLNINIHIKMSLSSLGEQKPTTSKKLPTTEELEKRLQVLEKQIEESNIRRSLSKDITSAPQSVKSEVHSENLAKNESPETKLWLEPKQTIEAFKNDNNEISLSTSTSTTECKDREVQENGNVEMEKEKPSEDSTEAHSIKVEKKCEEKKTSKINADDNQPQIEKKPNKNSVTENVSEKCQNMEAQSENEKKNKMTEKQEISNNQKDVTLARDEKVTEDLKTVKKQEKYVEKIETEEIVKESNSSCQSKPKSQEQTEKCSTTNVEKEIVELVNSNKTTVADSKIELVDSKQTTVVLLMDNQPNNLNMRRLTRANTAELEGLFEALEMQLTNRNLVKGSDGKLVRVDDLNKEKTKEEGKALKDLTNEIVQFTSNEKNDNPQEHKKSPKSEKKLKKEEEPYDWGENPVKHHLKRKTVYLPSTKELEARFRSFERQIKFLEDVEKIDVEQRLIEIERKIKLQYSLSHEKDLNKFLELCEGKDVDDIETIKPITENRSTSPKRSSSRNQTPHVSPSNKKVKSPYTSPSRSRARGSPSPARSNNHSPYISPSRKQDCEDNNNIPCTEDLEYRFRALDLKRSSSKENVQKMKKQPIHPLEMLLDPSPDDSDIPTTGELEHRMRMMDEKQKSLSSQKRRRSPSELPTAEELEARVMAMEEEQSFDIKTQKKFKEFNQKLKESVSPSLSFEEFQAARSREQSPHRKSQFSKSKSIIRNDSEEEAEIYANIRRPTSPKVIRFSDHTEEYEDESPVRPLSIHNRTVGDEALQI